MCNERKLCIFISFYDRDELNLILFTRKKYLFFISHLSLVNKFKSFKLMLLNR